MKKWLLLSLILNAIGILGFVGLLIYFGGWKNLRYRIQNRGLGKTYEMRKSHLENLPSSSESTIFIGNSLVAYGNWEERLSEFGVKNRGIAGDGIEGVIGRLSTLDNQDPRTIIILIGLNDLFFHEPGWLIDRYPKLITKVKKQFPEAKILMHSLLPLNTQQFKLGTTNSIISGVNKELAAICKAEKVEFINAYSLFLNKNDQLRADWTLDGIHLTGAAYSNWADYLNNTLKTVLSE